MAPCKDCWCVSVANAATATLKSLRRGGSAECIECVDCTKLRRIPQHPIGPKRRGRLGVAAGQSALRLMCARLSAATAARVASVVLCWRVGAPACADGRLVECALGWLLADVCATERWAIAARVGRAQRRCVLAASAGSTTDESVQHKRAALVHASTQRWRAADVCAPLALAGTACVLGQVGFV